MLRRLSSSFPRFSGLVRSTLRRRRTNPTSLSHFSAPLLSTPFSSHQPHRRHFSSSSPKLDNVTVVGGGLMGAGIAQVAAQAGHNVVVLELNEQALTGAKTNIEKSLTRIAAKKQKDRAIGANELVQSTMKNIVFTNNVELATMEPDVVIEAIIEDMGKKKDLFSKLDQMAPEKTVFASNTSSFKIGEIAKATDRPERFGGLHFFNPVPMMKLCEVIKTDATSPETDAYLTRIATSFGKTTVSCKDTPGFIVNRLLVPYMNEAIKMVEREVATPKDVDTAVKLGLGYPMGPFELSDYVGLDTMYYILKGWAEHHPEEDAFKPSESLTKLVKEGKFGRKTGEGFYNYKK